MVILIVLTCFYWSLISNVWPVFWPFLLVFCFSFFTWHFWWAYYNNWSKTGVRVSQVIGSRAGFLFSFFEGHHHHDIKWFFWQQSHNFIETSNFNIFLFYSQSLIPLFCKKKNEHYVSVMFLCVFPLSLQFSSVQFNLFPLYHFKWQNITVHEKNTLLIKWWRSPKSKLVKWRPPEFVYIHTYLYRKNNVKNRQKYLKAHKLQLHLKWHGPDTNRITYNDGSLNSSYKSIHVLSIETLLAIVVSIK